MHPRCNRACGRRAGGGLPGDRRSRTATAEVRRGAQGGGDARGAAGGGGEAQRLPERRLPGHGGPQMVWGTRISPLPGWPLECGVRLPAAMSPPSRPSRLLAARLGRRMDVVGTCPSECVCVSNAHSAGGRGRGAGEGARVRERWASLCPSVSPGSDSLGERVRVPTSVWPRGALGVTAEASQGRAALWRGHNPESMNRVAPARPVRGDVTGAPGPSVGVL